MIEEVTDITTIVDRIEQRQSAWITLADDMEKMWALDLWDGESDDEKTFITSADPFNAIATARRMINTVEPNVECPAIGFDEQSDQAQAMKERWLKAMWRQVRKEADENIVSSAFWQTLVLGKGVMQTLWIKDALPNRMKNNRLPFIIRTLDPRLCGFERGPLYLQYAYYKPTMTNMAIRQQWPDYEYEDGADDAQQDVIDFWWIDNEDGKVWHSVAVADEFTIPPEATKYYNIPLVPINGMYQPAEKEENRNLGLLFPLRSSWETTSDILTMVATSMLYHFLPAQPIVNEMGEAVNDEPLVPGEFRQYPPGTSFPNVQSNPNVPLADYVLRQLSEDMKDSTFTGIVNGQPLGGNEAGYSYNTAMAADESRITEFLTNLQSSMSSINEIVLAMVADMAGAKGVTVQGRSVSDGGRYIVELTKETVGDNFQNDVYLKPVLQRDEAAQIAMATRLVDGQIISKRTMRDTYIAHDLPDDEEFRIQLEKAMNNPATEPVVAKHTIEAYNSNSPAAQELLEILQVQIDTMKMQMAMQAQQMQAQAQQMQQQGQAQMPGGQGPSMSQGALSPQQEGALTQGSFAGNGERISPQDMEQIVSRGA